MTTTILTTQFILDSYTEPDITVPSVTVAYIKALLQPYEDMLQTVADVDNIRERINLIGFTDYILQYINEKIDESPRPLSVQKVREITLSALVYVLCQNGEAVIVTRNGYDDVSILPWDIQTGINTNPGLSRTFGLDEQENKLPVTFTVQTDYYTHMCSIDFTMGLLTFCRASNYDFHPRMFGELLGDNNHHYRYLEVFSTQYSVEVGEDIYDFNDPDFMQGFATGALWAGVDHHNYWTNLKQYPEADDDDAEEEPAGISITF